MNIQLATQSYRSKSSPLSAERLINFYAEKEPQDAKSPVAVFGSPGIASAFAVGNGPIRGMHVMGALLYVVSGPSLFSVNNLFTPTLLGTGIGGSGPVSIDDNGFQVAIANGASGFLWDTSTAAGTFTNLGLNTSTFYTPDAVTYFDGYFLWNRSGTNQFFYSGVDEGNSYNGLDYASAVVQSAFIKSIVIQQENLLLFTERTIETWADTGNNDSPFERLGGATVERGCAASYSTCKEDNSVFFLGNDRIFYRLNVPQPIRVSTSALEQEWQTYARVDDCFVFNINFEGHKFLFVNFPTPQKTFVYDISTDLWHDRVSYLPGGQSLGRYRANCAVVFMNNTLVGDAFGNQIGQLSSSSYSEYGAQMIGTMVLPAIHSDRKRIFHNSLEFDMETGIGLSSGQGSNPQIMLDRSDDGARTWRGPIRPSSIGAQGDYFQRVRFTRLGQARVRNYRVKISDPVRRTFIAARGDLEIGDL